MSVTFKRPPAAAKPAGSLGFELFQTAYVVRDLDAAMKTFKDNFGLGEFTMLPMPPMAEGASMRIALAWTAGHQIELIEAKGPGLELYTDWMLEGRNIRQHHFGYLIRDDAEWAALEKKLKDEGRDYVSAGDGGISCSSMSMRRSSGTIWNSSTPTPRAKPFSNRSPPTEPTRSSTATVPAGANVLHSRGSAQSALSQDGASPRLRNRGAAARSSTRAASCRSWRACGRRRATA